MTTSFASRKHCLSWGVVLRGPVGQFSGTIQWGGHKVMIFMRSMLPHLSPVYLAWRMHMAYCKDEAASQDN
eukprot:141266-Pelagomonas_calceolata.AAC.2